jgi:hypothetical protein
MRFLLCALALAIGAPATARAQAADTAAIAAQQAAMHKLDWMRGAWRGTAEMQTPQGKLVVTHTERVGNFLDGTLTLIEGKSFLADGSVGFNAFAVASYDDKTQTYWFDSHAQGRAGKFKLAVTGNGYVWEVPAGPATIRYAATFADGKWTEVGDYVSPGQPPRRIFSMTLSRVGDTPWPGGGAMTKD